MARTAVFALAALAALSGAAATRWHELEPKGYDFAQYVAEFGRSYSAEEFAMRKSIFDRRLSGILAHNRDPSQTWKAGVNELTDRTDEEFRARLGYKREIGYALTGDGQFDVEMEAKKAAVLDAPPSIDWRTKGVVSPVKDQGQCGSCWTFATAETVESRHALKYGPGSLAELSEQQVASCSPNPKDCGGTGGCEGGTAEVGYAGIQKAGGIASEWTYPYTSYKGQNSDCNASGLKKVATVTGYTKLGVNSYSDLMTAIQDGPVAISVAAMSWSSYESGVYNSCNKTDPLIDHAVQLVGYGTDSAGGDYWLVRNSWAPTWGENGYIRLARQGASAMCGTDTQPGQGTGCKGGPTTVKVCGTCGILYDNAVPIIG